MKKATVTATDWIIGVFVVGALLILVRPGSPAVLMIKLSFGLLGDLVSMAGGGPGTNPVSSPFQQ